MHSFSQSSPCGSKRRPETSIFSQPPYACSFLPSPRGSASTLPYGFTVATQLAFVPLVFALPAALVPPAVVAGLVLGELPYSVRNGNTLSRLFLMIGNSWFAIGPAAMFAFSGTSPLDASPALLVAALLAQFAVDFAASTLRLLADRSAGIRAQLGELWVYAIDAALSGVALVVAEEVDRTPAAVLTLLPLLGLFAVFARERHERMCGLLELNEAYRGTAIVLGDVVEADDGYTGEHCRDVVELATAVGRELGLDAERMRNLEFGALLHDVGKIAISKELIRKPGKLTPEEFKIVQTHTTEGQKLLDRVGGFMSSVGVIVRSHHERWDGRGYPDLLVGEDIPLEARIIACCDSWNAMRTDRPYRKALAYEVASAEMSANAGHQFDPTVVAAFFKVLEDGHAVGAPEAAMDSRNLSALVASRNR